MHQHAVLELELCVTTPQIRRRVSRIDGSGLVDVGLVDVGLVDVGLVDVGLVDVGLVDVDPLASDPLRIEIFGERACE